MQEETKPDTTKWLLLGILSLIWGSSFILMKRGLYQDGMPALSPLQLASARLFIAWLVLSPLLFKHAHLFRAHWKPLLGTAILGNGIPAFLFAVAQTSINSSLSGMLNSLTPLFTLLVGIALFGIRIRTINVVGILLGLAGAVGTIAYRHGDGLPSWTVHAVLPAIGALCYGFSGNIIKRWLYMLPAAATSVLAISIVGPMGLIGVLVTGLPHTLATVPNAWPALGFTAILATFSTGISLILWNALIKRTSAVWASSVTYLMPIVAIGWGVFDGEILEPMQFLMIAVILGGVYLVNLGVRK
ncbi:MAG: EamA family transporter [Flavobacteriales bacterium]|jgi:drug/metabolite transporter (DMT)-like permease|nr:EamA family transporter [Flavobacteriales bacterium]